MADTILRPIGAGDETSLPTQYPASGEHWEKVDESTSDGNDTYVSAFIAYPTTGGYRDLYTIESETFDDTISNVIIYASCKKVGLVGDASSVYLGVKTGGTIYASSAKALSASYAEYSHSYTTNPNTGIAWTQADIDALQLNLVLQMNRYGTGGGRASYGVCTQTWIKVVTVSARDKRLSVRSLWRGKKRMGR